MKIRLWPMLSRSLVQKTFDWDGVNVFFWRGRSMCWGTIAPK